MLSIRRIETGVPCSMVTFWGCGGAGGGLAGCWSRAAGGGSDGLAVVLSGASLFADVSSVWLVRRAFLPEPVPTVFLSAIFTGVEEVATLGALPICRLLTTSVT